MSVDNTALDLSSSEAVPLCQAAIQSILEAADVHALAIKGPAFVASEIRPKRASVDVDVLVDPRDWDVATTALRSVGWQDWAPESMWSPFGDHSITLKHVDWPCCVDLHYLFPGLLASPEDCFDALWDEHTVVEIAHQPVKTTCRAHSLAIEVLHLLRRVTPETEENAIQGILNRMPRPLEPDELSALENLTLRAGATDTLSTLAHLLGTTAGASTDKNHGLALDQWRARQRSSSPNSHWLVEGLRRSPLTTPLRLWRNLWLTKHQAETWAKAHGIPYRDRWQVLGLRFSRGFGAVRTQAYKRRPK